MSVCAISIKKTVLSGPFTVLPKPLPEPEVIDDGIHLTHLLNKGGMATIYLGSDTKGQDIAVKRLKPRYLKNERVRQMFLNEGIILSHLSHRNIVEYRSAGRGKTPFIAMEYIHGEQLNVVCRRGLHSGAFLPLNMATTLMAHAARGIAYFHEAEDQAGPLQIVHCDLSPTNLLVTEAGQLKIIDFGIAQARIETTWASGRIFPGKLAYMSPEQVKRQPLDRRSDIYSLGVVLYEITVGKRLFRGAADEVAKRIASSDVPTPSSVTDGFPQDLESIIMKMLDVDPSARYQSANDVAADLEVLAGQVPEADIAAYMSQISGAGEPEKRTTRTTWSDMTQEASQVAKVLRIDNKDFFDAPSTSRDVLTDREKQEPLQETLDYRILLFAFLAIICGAFVFVVFALL